MLKSDYLFKTVKIMQTIVMTLSYFYNVAYIKFTLTLCEVLALRLFVESCIGAIITVKLYIYSVNSPT